MNNLKKLLCSSYLLD